MMEISSGIYFYGSQATCEKIERAFNLFAEAKADRMELGESSFEQYEARIWFEEEAMALLGF